MDAALARMPSNKMVCGRMFGRWTEYCTGKMVPATFCNNASVTKTDVAVPTVEVWWVFGQHTEYAASWIPEAVIWACWVARPFLRYRAVKMQPTK